METEFRMVIGDDPDSDGLFGEIWFRGNVFAEIFEPPPYRIVVYPRRDNEPWEISLETMRSAIDAVKTRLDELQPRRDK